MEVSTPGASFASPLGSNVKSAKVEPFARGSATASSPAFRAETSLRDIFRSAADVSARASERRRTGGCADAIFTTEPGLLVACKSSIAAVAGDGPGGPVAGCPCGATLDGDSVLVPRPMSFARRVVRPMAGACGCPECSRGEVASALSGDAGRICICSARREIAPGDRSVPRGG